MSIIRRQGFFATVILCPFIFCLYIKVYSQPEGRLMQSRLPAPQRPAAVARTQATEICNNGIDDDNNQLTDEEDFGCYLPAVATAPCSVNPVVWVCTSDGKLCWGNLATGAEFMVGDDPGHFMLDIAWASDGKLYGVGGSPGGIFEIDPVTALATFKAAVPNQWIGPGNSLAADHDGNLYLVVSLPDPLLLNLGQVVRLNIATWQTCVIVPDLRALGLSSAGDLTFMNGSLYLSSGGNRIAKIDIQTGAVEAKDVTNSTTGGYFGLTTLGDGFLYASDRGKIYRIDPNTMIADIAPVYSFGFQNLFMNGLATYAELCNAPRCPNTVKIQPASPPPFCGQAQLSVLTSVSCFAGSGRYVWAAPDGNSTDGTHITATRPGKYVARYRSTPDTCSAADSMTIAFAQPPSVDLGADTSLCITEDLYLSPLRTTGVTAFRWQDGSTAERLFADKTGWYWLEATGICGLVRDSIHVTFRDDGCARLIYMPSAFSPNRDGRNDVLKPIVRNKLAEYEFSIFNRWGQKVFTTRDGARGWDGTLNGQPQNAGLFTWFCRYRFNRKPVQSIRGTVVLIR